MPTVNRFLDKYGECHSVNLDGIIRMTIKYGPELVDEIIGKFGSDYIGIIAPYYREFGEDLIREFLAEWTTPHKFRAMTPNSRDSILKIALMLYKELKATKIKGGRKKQYEILFKGDVQDVGLRGVSSWYAHVCGLTGTIENLPDGTVKAIVQGTEALMNVYVKGLKKRFQCSANISQQKIEHTFTEYLQK